MPTIKSSETRKARRASRKAQHKARREARKVRHEARKAMCKSNTDRSVSDSTTIKSCKVAKFSSVPDASLIDANNALIGDINALIDDIDIISNIISILNPLITAAKNFTLIKPDSLIIAGIKSFAKALLALTTTQTNLRVAQTNLRVAQNAIKADILAVPVDSNTIKADIVSIHTIISDINTTLVDTLRDTNIPSKYPRVPPFDIARNAIIAAQKNLKSVEIAITDDKKVIMADIGVITTLKTA